MSDAPGATGFPTPPAEGAPISTGGDASQLPPLSEEERRRQRLIFRRDLDEVYLLLDFVSGRPELSFDRLTMPDLDSEDPKAEWSSAQMVTEIMKIRFPPSRDEAVRARDASVLLIAKDKLSRLANPVRGQTIAYTALYVEVEGAPGPLGGIFRWMARPFRKPADVAKPPIPATGALPPSPGSEDAATAPGWRPKADALIELARESFPHFEDHAKEFYLLRWWLGWIFLIVFLLTAQMSWDVAHGRAVIQRLDQLGKDRATTIQANPDLIKAGVCPAYVSGDAKPRSQPEGWFTKSTPTACNQLWFIEKYQEEARLDLDRVFRCSGAWCNPYLHVFHWSVILCSGSDLNEAVPAAEATKHISWQSATSMLMVFTTYILPMFYGFLGTAIGAFRSIQDKVRDSLLAPRDLGLTILGTALGAVAGIVVGLFFGAAAVPVPGGGVAGDLSLTASGLGFLAGYGSQSFFKFIDDVLGKVFPANGSATAANGRPPAGAGRGEPPR